MRFCPEDSLVYAQRIAAFGFNVDDVLSAARKVQEFLSEPQEAPRPEWSEVSEYADAIAERDRARDTAVRLEQELAEVQRKLDEAEELLELEQKHVVKGVLIHIRDYHAVTGGGRAAIYSAVLSAATKFGVEL